MNRLVKQVKLRDVGLKCLTGIIPIINGCERLSAAILRDLGANYLLPSWFSGLLTFR
jgi:hypothetical protein